MNGRRLLRAVLAGGAAALLWGVVAALVFRLLMRAVAEVTSTATAFSPGGTAFIAVFFVVLALPGAVALAFSRSRWPWLVLGTGLGLLVVQAVGIGASDLGRTHHLTTGEWILLAAIFVAMAGVVGAEAVLIGRTARRWAVDTAPAPSPPLPEPPAGRSSGPVDDLLAGVADRLG
jgi:hypothetical protein